MKAAPITSPPRHGALLPSEVPDDSDLPPVSRPFDQAFDKLWTTRLGKKAAHDLEVVKAAIDGNLRIKPAQGTLAGLYVTAQSYRHAGRHLWDDG